MESRFSLLSDTHVNLWKYPHDKVSDLFPGDDSTLILAGDIGDPDEGSLYDALNMARTRYKRILYVPGNHEFYVREPGSKKTPASVLTWFQKLDDQWSNFQFFYRRNEVVDGIRIIGATGWTCAPELGSSWSNIIGEEGKKDIAFFEQSIAISKEPTLVISHYPSTLHVLQDHYKDKLTQFNYAQDLERLYRSPVKVWAFGHVHQKHDFTVPYSSLHEDGEVRLLCNPHGYPKDGITASIPKPFGITRFVKTEAKSLYGMSYRTL